MVAGWFARVILFYLSEPYRKGGAARQSRQGLPSQLTAVENRGYLGPMEKVQQNNKLPLEGLRILDLATFVASPFSAAILSEFGAEVIKIEQPGSGDPLRKFGTPSKNGDGYCWLSEQRNKRSITLDIRTEKGAEIFKRLIVGAMCCVRISAPVRWKNGASGRTC